MNNRQSLRTPSLHFGFWQSMRVRIALGILVILAVVLLLFGQLAISEQREKMMDQLRSYGTETAGFIAQISIVPLQKFSIYQLENYVQQLEQGELIAFCEIYDRDGSPLGHSTKSGAVDRGGEREVRDILIFSSPIVDNGTSLGRVELGVNLLPVLSRINRTSMYIAIAYGLQLLIIGVAVVLFLHRNLVAPVVRLSETTREIAAGRFVASDQAERPDEIGGLAKSINAMSANLQESYRNLELKVEKRTAELEAAKNSAEKMNRHLEIVSAEVEALLDNSPVGILFVTPNRIIQRVNFESCRISGYGAEELVGSTIHLLFPDKAMIEERIEKIFGIRQAEGLGHTTVKLRKKDESLIQCSMRGRMTTLESGASGVVLSMEDITVRLQMEAELLKISKLESIGVLAGGIAHDFNNILVSVLGNISLLERMIGAEKNDKAAELLAEARNASLKAKDLTFKLLTFAKGGDPVKKTEVLPDILRESVTFMLSGSNVKCVYDFAEGLWAVDMDRGQINQVVQNLVQNGCQAMPDGGTITLACSNRELADEEIAGLPAGRYVQLAITDTGRGIEEKHIGNIFDPYFSTRPKDSTKGSGLGLSIVRSIIVKHGGAIGVSSEPGQGSTFTLYLPAASQQEIPAERREAILPVGKGRILLMDDEETIHQVVGQMLAFIGYECLHAYDGDEAIAVYREQQERNAPVDAVIMDLTIPGGLGGAAAVKKLRAFDPAAKAIVSSGYSDDPVVQNYRAEGFVQAISKPYQLLELSQVIAETIGRPG
jgi:PAS domain S-box-containing protein